MRLRSIAACRNRRSATDTDKAAYSTRNQRREGMVDGVATLDEVVRRLAQRIDRHKTVRAPPCAATLQGRERLISAVSRQTSGAAPRRTRSAVALRREIDLLTL